MFDNFEGRLRLHSNNCSWLSDIGLKIDTAHEIYLQTNHVQEDTHLPDPKSFIQQTLFCKSHMTI